MGLQIIGKSGPGTWRGTDENGDQIEVRQTGIGQYEVVTGKDGKSGK